MADFDSFNYDINSRLPEWWKNDGALAPINKYTQDLISTILEGLLTSTGVVQPLNCWLTIPEEYNWFHHYTELDDYLEYDTKHDVINNPVKTLFGSDDGSEILKVFVPNTKKKCHAKIRLKLTGVDEEESEMKSAHIIKNLSLENGGQQIIFTNIPNTSTIEISTEDNSILIDGEENPDLVVGSFNKIEPTIKYDEYKFPDVDEIDEELRGQPIPIDFENKETKIIIKSTNTVNYDLQIQLLKPTYVTEQNIRIASVSAFPIEWVRLYGYFCHPFNQKEGYKFLWEKTYTQESRTVYDKIAKQYDCERFYIQVKFYGIGTPLEKGFPQSETASDIRFIPNPKLDTWGKVYGLPRRYYREDITEDEEPFTFPKYYPYNIEQDYWYEERMVNEYRINDDYMNSYFIKDNDFNNVATLDCIYPFMNDIWVYTETINPDADILHETPQIPLYSVVEDVNTVGAPWNDLDAIGGLQAEMPTILEPYNDETKKDNQFLYQTRKLRIKFNLNPYIEETPKDIKIKGIEVSFKARSKIQGNSIRLSDDSYIILPRMGFDGYDLDPILLTDTKFWIGNENLYTIGAPNYLFGEEEITREQLFNGNNGFIEFDIGFINENNFLTAYLSIEDIFLKIYYEDIPDDYDIKTTLNKKEIVLNDNNPKEIQLDVTVTKNVPKEIGNKEVFVVLPPELEFKNGFNSFTFNFEEDEDVINVSFVVAPKTEITGYYDIVTFCEDKQVFDTILIREGENEQS